MLKLIIMISAFELVIIVALLLSLVSVINNVLKIVMDKEGLRKEGGVIENVIESIANVKEAKKQKKIKDSKFKLPDGAIL